MSAGTIPRRHDLDALRSFAMLLGIVLHGAMAYIPYPEFVWPVSDKNQSELFSVLLSTVHGFRMPLFFLLSGFFTAMLWRKRGLHSLLMQRKNRILIPLVVATITINPLVLIVSGIANPPEWLKSKNSNSVKETSVEVWSSLEGIQSRIASERDPNETLAGEGATAMWFAALRGDKETISYLIDNDADVNARNHDGSTPLYAAALYGLPEVAKQLIENGAKVQIRNRAGESPGDMLSTDSLRLTVTKLISGTSIPDLSGRHEVAELIRTAGGEVPHKIVDVSGTWFQTAMLALTVFPLFGHLWFLWYLCWLVVAFAIYAKLCDQFKWRIPNGLVLSPFRYLWLIPITMAPAMYMGTHFPTFGPDTYSGIIPMPYVLIYYAAFFFFGAFYFDASGGDGEVGRRWYINLPLTLGVVFPIGYSLIEGNPLFLNENHFDAVWYRPLGVFIQVLYTWLMTFGLMGLSRKVFSKSRFWIRYLSDSSYWLYLIHLPLIVIAQTIISGLDISAGFKLLAVCVVVCLMMLLSYDKWIRYGKIGTALNGPRTRPE